MHLKRIKLHNIRSYADADILFPEGTLLLGGDIGSGKSSLLLAIDFAFFGLTTDLTGAALLRNGESEGSVELSFEADGKDVVIQRVLKRGLKIQQSAGHLILDGRKQELTPTELRQAVIDLFGYPQELLTKKSLIYRYTVYTPQEEMKLILLGEKESRLDLLRKIFGIDKYYLIRQNTESFIKILKSKMRECAAYVAALDHTVQDLDALRHKKNELLNLIQQTQQRHISSQEALRTAEAHLASLDAQRKQLLERRHHVELVQTRLQQKRRDQERLLERKTTLEQDIEKMQLHLAHSLPERALPGDLDELKRQLHELERQRETRLKEIQRCEVSINHSQQTVIDIQSFDVCPLCTQPVDVVHIATVHARENSKQEQLATLLEELRRQARTLDLALASIKNDVETLVTLRQQQEILAVHEKAHQEKSRELQEVLASLHTLRDDSGHLHKELAELPSLPADDVEQIHARATEMRQRLLDEERATAFELAGHLQTQRHLDEQSHKFALDLASLEEKKTVLVQLRNMRTWMEDLFLPLMSTMEKKVLARVHADFDSLFQKWFGMLIDTSLLQVRLDEVFTPVILQNGHELDYLYLSGGEKTAVALAYRLALNQVINNLMSVLKTRDLLILDEPTDGFSSEQLDRLRDVLDELHAKQIILVSHEQKIEGFVDAVIRLEKSEHVTHVVR